MIHDLEVLVESLTLFLSLLEPRGLVKLPFVAPYGSFTNLLDLNVLFMPIPVGLEVCAPFLTISLLDFGVFGLFSVPFLVLLFEGLAIRSDFDSVFFAPLLGAYGCATFGPL